MCVCVCVCLFVGVSVCRFAAVAATVHVDCMWIMNRTIEGMWWHCCPFASSFVSSHFLPSERLSYLHWLPVSYQIQLKIAALTYKTLATCQPSYLVNFAVYAHTLIRQLPVPLLFLSHTPNLITVILLSIIFLSLNYPVSSRSKTLLLVLSWTLPSHVISPLFYAFFTGSGSLNASSTSSFHLSTKFLQIPNLHKLISTQRPHSTRSSPLVTLARPPSSLSLKITDRSFCYASPCL